MAKVAPRKKLPKELAVINADNCTGCESCLEVCPVDCITKIQQFDGLGNLQSWCQIELTVCPWDAIEMVPTEQVAVAVAQIGGPPEYIREHWDRLVGTAQHLAELKASS